MPLTGVKLGPIPEGPGGGSAKEEKRKKENQTPMGPGEKENACRIPQAKREIKYSVRKSTKAQGGLRGGKKDGKKIREKSRKDNFDKGGRAGRPPSKEGGKKEGKCSS